MQYLVDLINQAHADANAMRKRRGLDPYPFKDVKEHKYDPHHIIRSVISERSHEMGNKISNVVCACGCNTLMMQSTVDAGWAFIYGHKKNVGVSVNGIAANSKNSQLNKQAAAGQRKHSDIADYSPAKLKQIYEAQRKQAIEENRALQSKVTSAKQLVAALEREFDASMDNINNLDHAILVFECLHTKQRCVPFGSTELLALRSIDEKVVNRDFGVEHDQAFQNTM
jgi:hypothetical protein